MHIAEHSHTQVGMLLATGLTAVIATQTFLNIGGVTKFVPLTGITLPFISQGGTSLLTAFGALGLLLAISDTVPTAPRKASRPPAPPRDRGQPKTRPPATTPPPDQPAPKRRRARKRAPDNGDEAAG
jgi:hypothetical protein